MIKKSNCTLHFETQFKLSFLTPFTRSNKCLKKPLFVHLQKFYFHKVQPQLEILISKHNLYHQGIIQKKSASGSQNLKCQKWSLKWSTLVSTAIYQTTCSFTVQSALFLLFQKLPYDIRLFSDHAFFFIPRKN